MVQVANFYNRLVTYTPKGEKKQRKFKNFENVQSLTFDATQMTRSQRFCLIGVLVIAYLLIASLLLTVMFGSVAYASTLASENTLTEQLISGTFDTRDEINNTASSFFTKLASGVFSVALPFMSAFALTMITLSLVSSIIYFSKPDFFNDVHDLVSQRKSSGGGPKGPKGLLEYYHQKGLREFLMSYCIDFKLWAFQDSVNAGVEGNPTFQDLIRNMPKYVLMFTFCILITNRVLLDFLMTGAKVCATVAEKVTYDYNYVEMIENFIDMGDRYVPQQWTGKSRENANLMATYRAIYNTVIANLDDVQKDTESLQYIGMNVEQYIAKNIIPKEHWDRKVFSAKAEYVTTRKTNVDTPGTYYISGSELGMVSESGDVGYIMLYIRSESDDKAFTDTAVTRYPGAWNGTPPTTFDIKAIPGMPVDSNSIDYIISKGTVLVRTADGQAYNATMSPNKSGVITIDYSLVPSEVRSKIRSVTISGMTIKVRRTVGGDSRTEPFTTFDKPVWVNSEVVPTGPGLQPEKPKP